MAVNFPGPYEVEIHYTSNSNAHVQRLNCDVLVAPDPGDPASTIDLKLRGGGTEQLDIAVIAWCDLIGASYETTTTFDNFTLWAVDPGTFDKTFITTEALAIDGTGGGSTIPEHQLALTFRTVEGGTMRVVLLESMSNEQDRVSYANTGALVQGIMDFVVSTNGWILARDTSYPIASLNSVGGQNESLFKRAHR